MESVVTPTDRRALSLAPSERRVPPVYSVGTVPAAAPGVDLRMAHATVVDTGLARPSPKRMGTRRSSRGQQKLPTGGAR